MVPWVGASLLSPMVFSLVSNYRAMYLLREVLLHYAELAAAPNLHLALPIKSVVLKKA